MEMFLKWNFNSELLMLYYLLSGQFLGKETFIRVHIGNIELYCDPIFFIGP